MTATDCPLREKRNRAVQQTPCRYACDARQQPAKSIVLSKRAAIVALAAVLTGTVSSAAAAIASFTVVALPDTQYYSSLHPGVFDSQTQWIVDNQTAKNIKFTSHQGDLTDYDALEQWYNASGSMYKLDNTSPRLPWGTVMGNHDDPGHYDVFFGPSHFAGQTWYGGSYGHSSYQTSLAGGRNYLMLDLEDNAPADVRSWAQSVINANPGKPTIVNTHEYLQVGGRTEYGNTLWNELIRPNSQVFAVLCGHITGEYHQTSYDAAGKSVFELLADYQDDSPGWDGNGYLRLYEFDEAHSKIKVKTYAPNTDVYKTDLASQFNLSLNFNSRLGRAQSYSGMALDSSAGTAVPEPSPRVITFLGVLSLAIGRRFARTPENMQSQGGRRRHCQLVRQF